jgi:hypothetical protein
MAPGSEARLKFIGERFGPRCEHRFEQLAFEFGTPALNDVWTFHGVIELTRRCWICNYRLQRASMSYSDGV